MKKVLFLIPSLVGGGAERVLVLLLRHLDLTRYQPVVVLFDSRNDYAEEVPTHVKKIFLNKRGSLDNMRLILSLAAVIKKENPDLICSFMTYTNYLSVLALKLSRSKARLILTEHNNLSIALKREKFAFIKGILVRKLYPKADLIVCVSKGVLDDLSSSWGISYLKCRVIYNPVEIDRVQSFTKENASHPWFHEDIPLLIACGRLTAQKNYSMLLRAVALLLKDTPVRLVILGEGEDRSMLESYSKELKIHSNVAFLGFQSNPFKYLAKASIFVLSSSWEGFGNVILEAMASGAPVISTRCPSGPDEIITNGVDGILVPVGNEKALSDAILKLLSDQELRRRFSTNGRKRVADFKVEKIVAEYEKVFDEV